MLGVTLGGPRGVTVPLTSWPLSLRPQQSVVRRFAAMVQVNAPPPVVTFAALTSDTASVPAARIGARVPLCAAAVPSWPSLLLPQQ